MFKGPDLSDEQVRTLVEGFPKDKRWDWTGLVNGDLSYYDMIES